jgi:hypothetical protein
MQPSAASSCAVANPIPCVAPVISATLPWSDDLGGDETLWDGSALRDRGLCLPLLAILEGIVPQFVFQEFQILD